MSRSRRKTPVFGWTNCKSEKQDKQEANRSLRRINKARVQNGNEPMQKKENRDIWGFGKDGKGWMGPWWFEHDRNLFDKHMRK